MMNKFARAVLLLAAAFPLAAQGPAFDNSGNNLLNGTYYFREVYQIVSDNAGDLNQAIAVYGTISFNGAGAYTLTGATVYDSNAGAPQAYTGSGTYSVAASGYGFMTTTYSPKDTTYIMVSPSGILIGSATETANGFNEMIVGAPLASPAPTNGSFNGNYTMTGFLPGGSVGSNASLSFPLVANGAGSLGNVGVSGYFAGNGATVVSQAYNGVKYNFQNGAAIVTFPTNANAYFFSGQEYLYFSPDGNFVFGGAPNYFDMLIGIKNPASGASPQLSGLYYQAGIDLDASTFSSGYVSLDTYYGSFSASQGNTVAADRLLSPFNPSVLTASYSDTYPATITAGNYTSGGTQYWLNADGSIRIGSGTFPYLNLSVAFLAPSFVNTAVNAPFIYPNGISNSASAAPFTSGVSSGELITIYGSGLAASTVVTPSAPFPTTLGNVQVLIDGVPAPLYYVSPGQISAIVPSGSPFAVAKIQVALNGLAAACPGITSGNCSNTVTEFVRTTTPGVFSLSANGLGSAAAVHNDTGAVVTSLNPAQPGEYLQIFLTGLGAVYPTSPDGAPGPTNPLSNTASNFTVYFGGTAAPTPQFAGLAPTLAGLYQINVQVPTGLAAGNYALEVDGPDSYTVESQIPVGNGSTGTLSEVPATTSAVGGRHTFLSRQHSAAGKLPPAHLQ